MVVPVLVCKGLTTFIRLTRESLPARDTGLVRTRLSLVLLMTCVVNVSICRFRLFTLVPVRLTSLWARLSDICLLLMTWLSAE